MRRFFLYVVPILAGFAAAQAAEVALFHHPRHDPVVDPSVALAAKVLGGDRVPVWVFFTDKAISSVAAYEKALADVNDRYSSVAKKRRALRRTLPGLFDHHDVPLPTAYVASVAATGAHLRTKNRWLCAVSVDATIAQIEAIAALPYVRFIKPVARGKRVDPTPARGEGGVAGDFYGFSSEQLLQINIPAVHDAGYTGAGVIIGILDTGFTRTHEAFNEPGHPLNVLGEWDVINDDSDTGIEPGDPDGQYYHGTLILGTIGGYKPNVLVGGAYDASFYLAKTEDISSETPIEEDFYAAGLQWIEENGGDVATSSLSYNFWNQEDYDGLTAVSTIAVNIATGNGVVCCTAAGNAGHDDDPATWSLHAPADALQVLTCGAVWSNGDIANFSSDGPSADGRVKPEVLARGVGTWTVEPNDDLDYRTASGTSLSTPLVASAAALIVQAHPNWTVAQIRSALFQTAADYLVNQTFDPLFVRGYGVIDVMATINRSFIGDIDRDGDTDLDDHSLFVGCMSGPGVPPIAGCESADVDLDGDVDGFDFSLLQTNFTGAWIE